MDLKTFLKNREQKRQAAELERIKNNDSLPISNVTTRTVDEKDLLEFVHISAQHGHLTGYSEKRIPLYKNWYKNCPRAFHVLEFNSVHNEAKKIAVISIILPLSKTGVEIINRNEKTAFDIRDADIDQRQNNNYSKILFDTLAVATDIKDIQRPRLVYQLITDHLKSLLGTKTKKEIDFYVEPDLVSVIKILKILRFEKIDKKGEEDLYYRKIAPGLIIDSFYSICRQVSNGI
jgi:hypothetical protein